jgi:hypothetical protein
MRRDERVLILLEEDKICSIRAIRLSVKPFVLRKTRVPFLRR